MSFPRTYVTTMDVALPAGASSNELAKLRKRVALLERMRADDAALRALQLEDADDVDTEAEGGFPQKIRGESTGALPLPPPPPANREKRKESSPVAMEEEPAAVDEVAPPTADGNTLKIFGIECDSVKMCTGVMNDVVGKMDASNSSAKDSSGMFLHEVSLRSIVLNHLFDNCDAVVDDVFEQCVERFHLPATKESDRWWFDYGLSHTWTPDGPVVERTVLDAADALNALKTPSPVGSQDTTRVFKRKPRSLELWCIAMGRDGPCTKRVSKERASIGKVTCGYHDNQEPDDDDTDGEYEVIATPIQPNVALVSEANTVAALTQSIGRVARDKKRKTTVAVEPSQSKRVRWTDEEHQLFLEGIKQFGKGAEANRQISEKFVTTKTPSQVASHAQKYYLKAPLEDSAINNVGRTAVTGNFTTSQLDINNIVWVKTGKTAHWPGHVWEIHNGHGQCKTSEGFSPSEFNDGKERFVVRTYDDKLIEPKTTRNITYFCPGTHFERYKKAAKTPGFINAMRRACDDYNKSRLDYDKSKNTKTAPEHLCTF